MGSVPAGPTPPLGPPPVSRRIHHSHLPSPSLPHQKRLPETLRLLLLLFHFRPRRSGAIGHHARRGLPQSSLRHLLQLLRRDEAVLPQRHEVDRTRGGDAPRAAGGGDSLRRERRRRGDHHGGDGEDASDEVRGVRGLPHRPSGAAAVREGEEGPRDREPRSRVRGEGGGLAVRVPAVRDQGS